MDDDQLAEFKQKMEHLRASFDNHFWHLISPDINALVSAVNSFNDRLVALERKAKS